MKNLIYLILTFFLTTNSYSYSIIDEAGNYSAPILAGQNILVGNVTISNTSDNLIISANTDILNNWYIQKVHVYVSTSSPILGTPVPGQFPYHSTTYQPPVSQYKLEIPLNLLNINCESSVFMAIHFEIVKYKNGTVVQSETGWAYGLDPFNSNRWGWQFTYQLKCHQNEYEGCTYTQGYWKNHSKYSKTKKEFWPKPIGQLTDSEDSLLCGLSLFKILTTTPKTGNAWYILAHQYIAAKLNQFNGASALSQLNLLNVEQLLQQNCSSIKSSSLLGQQSLVFAGILASYNEGLLEVPHCSL